MQGVCRIVHAVLSSARSSSARFSTVISDSKERGCSAERGPGETCLPLGSVGRLGDMRRGRNALPPSLRVREKPVLDQVVQMLVGCSNHPPEGGGLHGADVNHTRGTWAGWEEQSGVIRVPRLFSMKNTRLLTSHHGLPPDTARLGPLRGRNVDPRPERASSHGSREQPVPRPAAVPHASTPIVMTGLMSCPSTHTLPLNPTLWGAALSPLYERGAM